MLLITSLLFLLGADQPAPRFSTLDVFIDSGATPLAVYQLELKTLAGDVQIVGIERGDDPNFHDPPYYDPAALFKGRIIIGSYSTAEKLPAGESRIARLHLRIAGANVPQYAATLNVAGDKDGKPIQAKVIVREGAKP